MADVPDPPAGSPRTSSISPARCAPPAFRSGPGAVLDALEALQDGRRRHPRGFLLDAARGVREAPRAFGAVRSGVSHLLPPPRLYRSDAGDDAAAGAVGAAAAAGRRDPRARGAVLRPRRQAEKRARDRARRAHDRIRPRSAAAQGFRADDERRDRRRQGGDEAARAAARGSAHAAACAASARPSDRHPPHACARA